MDDATIQIVTQALNDAHRGEVERLMKILGERDAEIRRLNQEMRRGADGGFSETAMEALAREQSDENRDPEEVEERIAALSAQLRGVAHSLAPPAQMPERLEKPMTFDQLEAIENPEEPDGSGTDVQAVAQ